MCMYSLSYSFFFKYLTGSIYVALLVLEFTMYTRLASDSQRSAYLRHPSARNKVMFHHTVPQSYSILPLNTKAALMSVTVFQYNLIYKNMWLASFNLIEMCRPLG